MNDSLLWHSDREWDKHTPIQLDIYHNNKTSNPIWYLHISLETVDVVSSSYRLARPKPITVTNNVTNLSVEIEVMVWCSNGYYGETCNQACQPDVTDCNIAKCAVGRFNSSVGFSEILFHCRGKSKCEHNVCVCPDNLAGSMCNVANKYSLPFGNYYNFLESRESIECKSRYTGFNCDEENFCFDNPCKNGRCLNETNRYICICNDGFHGYDCDKDMNNCHYKACQNNGTCKQDGENYTCICLAGYQGRYCEIDIDFCSNDTCHNNGTCVEEPANYTCNCLTGYTGRHCEVDIDYCFKDTCYNNGTCVEEPANYKCNCLTGYTGRHCEIDIDYCSKDTCHNNGTCVEEPANYTCNCLTGYTGRHCEIDINYCSKDTCHNNGTCVEEPANYTCNCLTGYTGRHCEIDINYCSKDTCHNNGSCVDEPANYNAIVLLGIQGDTVKST
ncbi:fibropellin-1-like [Mercenaria mercenaria]|uniref:fibropellin-1-like n=1 Tax=Mercenaria mercenaria TaxID=6596 RepID=UPI00234F7ED8|nr:fibropellin-1-like [Mercenaria mercenaria]